MIRILVVFGLWSLSLAPAFACGLDVFPPLPPGIAPRLVQTPLCRYLQNSACEFRFGPNRRLRVPADLLHPVGVSHVRAPTGEYESGLVQTTWGRLRTIAGQTSTASGDEATVQVHFTSEPRTGLGSLRMRLNVSAPEQLPAVQEACAQQEATLAFAGRDGVQWELVFRGGHQATERRCQPGYRGTVGTCSVLALQGGLMLDFWYDRRIEPPTREAVALVTSLLDSFVVEGPKLRPHLSDDRHHDHPRP